MKVQDTGRPQSTKKPGRPRIGDKATRPVNLTLDADDIEQLKDIGGGNVSRGVRRILFWLRNKFS